MIVVYPMMVSNAVSENTLPALGKMLELYILTYMQDDVLNSMNGKFGGVKPKLRYKIKGNKIIGESIDLSEANDELGGLEGGETPGTKGNMAKDDHERAKETWTRVNKEVEKLKKQEEMLRQQEEQVKERLRDLKSASKREKREERKAEMDEERFELQKKYDKIKNKREKTKLKKQQQIERGKLTIAQDKEAREKRKEKAEAEGPVKVSLTTYDRAITIEPTWTRVDTDRYGSQLIGVKVVPYRVKSDAKLSHLIMHDAQIKAMTSQIIGLGRRLMGKMMRLIHRGPVSGDPKKDIIYRTTSHRAETFVVLEKNNDVDEYFLNNAGKINKLFRLGWGNFVIADDVLQVAFFCMRAQKGICQGMSYRMLYKTLGQSGVYEDLEDVRKQNASMFKMKRVRFSKLLGESKADEKLINYQERQ